MLTENFINVETFVECIGIWIFGCFPICGKGNEGAIPVLNGENRDVKTFCPRDKVFIMTARCHTNSATTSETQDQFIATSQFYVTSIPIQPSNNRILPFSRN